MMHERYVVWSPSAAACMAWASQAKAERFAGHWNDCALLGCADWRVGRIGDVVERSAAAPSAIAVTLSVPEAAANDHPAPADDTLVGRLLAQLDAKDALIEELRHKLNEYVLCAVRECAEHNGRIAELEAEVAALRRRAHHRHRA